MPELGDVPQTAKPQRRRLSMMGAATAAAAIRGWQWQPGRRIAALALETEAATALTARSQQRTSRSAVGMGGGSRTQRSAVSHASLASGPSMVAGGLSDDDSVVAGLVGAGGSFASVTPPGSEYEAQSVGASSEVQGSVHSAPSHLGGVGSDEEEEEDAADDVTDDIDEDTRARLARASSASGVDDFHVESYKGNDDGDDGGDDGGSQDSDDFGRTQGAGSPLMHNTRPPWTRLQSVSNDDEAALDHNEQAWRLKPQANSVKLMPGKASLRTMTRGGVNVSPPPGSRQSQRRRRSNRSRPQSQQAQEAAQATAHDSARSKLEATAAHRAKMGLPPARTPIQLLRQRRRQKPAPTIANSRRGAPRQPQHPEQDELLSVAFGQSIKPQPRHHQAASGSDADPSAAHAGPLQFPRRVPSSVKLGPGSPPERHTGPRTNAKFALVGRPERSSKGGLDDEHIAAARPPSPQEREDARQLMEAVQTYVSPAHPLAYVARHNHMPQLQHDETVEVLSHLSSMAPRRASPTSSPGRVSPSPPPAPPLEPSSSKQVKSLRRGPSATSLSSIGTEDAAAKPYNSSHNLLPATKSTPAADPRRASDGSDRNDNWGSASHINAPSTPPPEPSPMAMSAFSTQRGGTMSHRSLPQPSADPRPPSPLVERTIAKRKQQQQQQLMPVTQAVQARRLVPAPIPAAAAAATAPPRAAAPPRVLSPRLRDPSLQRLHSSSNLWDSASPPIASGASPPPMMVPSLPLQPPQPRATRKPQLGFGAKSKAQMDAEWASVVRTISPLSGKVTAKDVNAARTYNDAVRVTQARMLAKQAEAHPSDMPLLLQQGLHHPRRSELGHELGHEPEADVHSLLSEPQPSIAVLRQRHRVAKDVLPDFVSGAPVRTYVKGSRMPTGDAAAASTTTLRQQLPSMPSQHRGLNPAPAHAQGTMQPTALPAVTSPPLVLHSSWRGRSNRKRKPSASTRLSQTVHLERRRHRPSAASKAGTTTGRPKSSGSWKRPSSRASQGLKPWLTRAAQAEQDAEGGLSPTAGMEDEDVELVDAYADERQAETTTRAVTQHLLRVLQMGGGYGDNDSTQDQGFAGERVGRRQAQVAAADAIEGAFSDSLRRSTAGARSQRRALQSRNKAKKRGGKQQFVNPLSQAKPLPTLWHTGASRSDSTFTGTYPELALVVDDSEEHPIYSLADEPALVPEDERYVPEDFSHGAVWRPS